MWIFTKSRWMIAFYVCVVHFDQFAEGGVMEEVSACFRQKSSPRKKRRSTVPAINYTYFNPYILMNPVVDDKDISEIMTLSQCVKDLYKGHFEDRHFDQGVTGYGGGNNVTYLGGFAQALMPEFVNYMSDLFRRATEVAGWRPHPAHLGIRCIETLVYSAGGELLYHKDSDSIYTAVVVLSDPSLYTGGSFVIEGPKKDPVTKKGKALFVRPPLGGAMLFDSNAEHGVEPIKSGNRTVLVFELWPFVDTGIYDLRPAVEFYKDRPVIPTMLIAPPQTATPTDEIPSAASYSSSPPPSDIKNDVKGETQGKSKSKSKTETKSKGVAATAASSSSRSGSGSSDENATTASDSAGTAASPRSQVADFLQGTGLGLALGLALAATAHFLTQRLSQQGQSKGQSQPRVPAGKTSSSKSETTTAPTSKGPTPPTGGKGGQEKSSNKKKQ